MGKNHPTPGAAMAFFILKTTPTKTGLFQTWKNFFKNIFTFVNCECILELQPTKNVVEFIAKKGGLKNEQTKIIRVGTGSFTHVL